MTFQEFPYHLNMNATLSCKSNTQRILVPGDSNWVQHWVSRLGLLFYNSIHFQIDSLKCTVATLPAVWSQYHKQYKSTNFSPKRVNKNLCHFRKGIPLGAVCSLHHHNLFNTIQGLKQGWKLITASINWTNFFYFLHLLHSTLIYSSFEMVGMITIIYSNC